MTIGDLLDRLHDVKELEDYLDEHGLGDAEGEFRPEYHELNELLKEEIK